MFVTTNKMSFYYLVPYTKISIPSCTKTIWNSTDGQTLWVEPIPVYVPKENSTEKVIFFNYELEKLDALKYENDWFSR